MRQVFNFALVLALVGCSKGTPAAGASAHEEAAPGGGRPAPSARATPANPPSAPAQRQVAAGDNFEFSRAVAAGRRIYVRNLNGSIRAEGHDGDEVEVVAEVRHRGSGDPADVRFEVVEHDGAFTLCALWPADHSECGARGDYDHDDVHRNSTSVDMVVRVPSGVEVDVATVNGGTRVSELGAAVWASSVNGKVRVDTNDGPVEARSVNGKVSVRTGDGPVSAGTVNGGIDVEIGKLTAAGPMEFSTVNGSIDLELPDGFGAELEASVLNGSISADLPLSRVKSAGRRHLDATIGDGGPRLEASTTNGSIRLR